MSPTTFYVVWRRSDGYVGCTTGRRGGAPANGRDKFDVLLVTDNWPEAHAKIEAERDERHRALVASWTSEAGT